MQPVSNSIQIIGPVGSLGDGYAYHNRAFIKLLYANGYNIKAISSEVSNKGVPMSEDQYLIKILTESKPKPEGDIIFNFCIPPLYNLHPSKINIAFTSWEVDVVPSSWVNNINKLHALFVPSIAIKNVMTKSGVTVPMYVLPYPISQSELDNITPIDVMSHLKRSCTFLYSCSYTPRKNIEDLVMAFCSSFDGNEDVALVIKTWAANNDNGARSAIQNSIGHLSNKMNCIKKPTILVVTDLMEDQDFKALVKGSDVYVTTSRGEGLDSGLITAMGLGKVCVSDANLGHSDYVDSNNSIRYTHLYRPVVDSGTPYHSAKMRWAYPEYASLCKALHLAYAAVKENNKIIGSNAKKNVCDRYADYKVVDRFNEDLKEIISRHEQKIRTSLGNQLQTSASP